NAAASDSDVEPGASTRARGTPSRTAEPIAWAVQRAFTSESNRSSSTLIVASLLRRRSRGPRRPSFELDAGGADHPPPAIVFRADGRSEGVGCDRPRLRADSGKP